MKINNSLAPLSGVQSLGGKGFGDKTLKETNSSFSDTLSRAVKDVNALQTEAGNAVNKMVAGQDVDLHEVMIAVEKAKTSFDLLMEVRNKAIDAYRELMRIQV